VNVSPVSPIEKPRSMKTQNRGRGLQTPTRENALNQSSQAILSSARAEKKLNSSNLNSSKIESPLAQILDRAHSPQHSKEVINITNLNQRLSREMNSPNRNSTKSLIQRDSSSNSRTSFVQSEFNHITGAVKFSKSPRSREHIDLNPGPGTYDPLDTKHSPSARFEKTPKVCWFDVVSKNDSPGPHLNPSHHFLSK